MRTRQVFPVCGIMLLMLLLSWGTLSATEKPLKLDISMPDKPIAKIINLSASMKVDLKKIRNITVLVSSTYPFLENIAEDQLSVKLRDKGLDVVPQKTIMELAVKEARTRELEVYRELIDLQKRQLELMQKQKSAGEKTQGQEKMIEDGTTSSAAERLESVAVLGDFVKKQLEQLGKTPEKETLDLVEIGRKLKLDAIIEGILLEGRQQTSNSEKKQELTIERTVVATFFLKVTDTKTGSVVLTILLEAPQGLDVMSAVDELTKLLVTEIQP